MKGKASQQDLDRFYESMLQLSDILREIGVAELVIDEDQQEVTWDQRHDGKVERRALHSFCDLIEAYHGHRRSENPDFCEF